MLLEGKVAVIYGGGGAIGGAVARVFAREGARVYLAGRTTSKLDRVAGDIRSKGGVADAAVVDAIDEKAVTDFVNGVVKQTGHIDISFNLISYGEVQKPLVALSVDDFLRPITTAMRTHFLTTRAVAPHMMTRGSGVILAFGGSGPQTQPGMGGFKIALDALEGLRRQWAIELGPHGIRVVTLKTGGVPESMPDDTPGRDEIIASIENATLLKRAASLDDVGRVAAFIASDQARTITAADINISSGGIMD